jgi:alkylated DNA nucleotide flippase Atl1
VRAEYVEAVLAVVDTIPAGRVLSYGDIAVLLEDGGPRQVGAVLSRWMRDNPWWRVVRASGLPPQGHAREALVHYQAEGTPLRGTPSGSGEDWRVDLKACRWVPDDAAFELLDALRDTLHAAKMSVPADGIES